MTRARAVATVLSKATRFIGFGRFANIALFALLMVSSVFAATDQLTTTLTSIYCMLNGIIPIMAFTLMVLAGVAYGIGNFFGAEVRAKANAWAMSCITGAIIALLIIVFSNVLIDNLIGPGYTRPTC